jgi:putative tricarboxylic transport membrane protein
MGTSDILVSVILLALSAAFFAATFSFPKLTVALSPTVFPRFVTVGLFFLSALLLIQGLSRRPGRRGGTAPVSAPKRPFALRFLLLAAGVLLYVLALEPAGYLLVTPPFLVGAMLLFGERKWHRLLAVSVLSTVILSGLFRMVFRVPLPRSPLW